MVVAALFGAGIAYAAIPGPDGVIHGCYSTGLGSGALYVIDSEEECPTGYAALNWDQTAPAGVAGYEVVTFSDSTSQAQAHTVSTQVACPAGKVALGGGVNGPIAMTSRPLLDVNNLATGWYGQVQEQEWTSSNPIHIQVWAICATAGD